MEIYRTNKMQKDWEADIKLYEARIQNLENELLSKNIRNREHALKLKNTCMQLNKIVGIIFCI